jgi:hypothetical protein
VLVMPDLGAFFHALLLVAVGALLVLGGLAVWLVGRLAEPTVVDQSHRDGRPPTEPACEYGRMDGSCCPGCGQLTAVERAARLLEVQPTVSRPVVEAAYKKLATLDHADKGGDEELMKRLTRARDLLLQPR